MRLGGTGPNLKGVGEVPRAVEGVIDGCDDSDRLRIGRTEVIGLGSVLTVCLPFLVDDDVSFDDDWVSVGVELLRLGCALPEDIAFGVTGDSIPFSSSFCWPVTVHSLAKESIDKIELWRKRLNSSAGMGGALDGWS